ncbi:MAG: hypothetical protein WDN06_11910 [Asticcacaulis sp.]
MSGDIAIDGRPLEGQLTGSIGWMGQATPILAGSLRDNLMLARRGAFGSRPCPRHRPGGSCAAGGRARSRCAA